MKIIHLSDVHCGNIERYKKFHHLLEKVKRRFNSGEAVVCITGDLIDDVGSKDFNLVKIKSLIDETLVKHGYKVLIAPGNHDYGNGDFFPDNVGEFVKDFKRLFFSNCGMNYNLPWDSENFYPKLDIVGNGDSSVAFICLDSNEGELGNPFKRLGADGRIGKGQRKRLIELLNTNNEIKQCKYRVIYFHHNVYECVLPEVIEEFHELHDRKKLGEILLGYCAKFPQSPINAILYGHEHLFRKEIPGLWGIQRCYDAGSSTGKETTGWKKTIFNVLSIHKQPTKVRIIDLSKDQAEDLEEDWLEDF